MWNTSDPRTAVQQLKPATIRYKNSGARIPDPRPGTENQETSSR
jgi:hypothetical protein